MTGAREGKLLCCVPASALLLFPAAEPIFGPWQKRGYHKKAELPATCHENVDSAANRQDDADDNDPLRAAKVFKDGSVPG